MERLRAEGLTVGDNEPYSGADGHGYTQHTHGDRRGLANVLIEVRQDLIDTPQGAALWAERLGAVLGAVLGDPALYRIERSEAHTPEPQALIRSSYPVPCWKQKKKAPART